MSSLRTTQALSRRTVNVALKVTPKIPPANDDALLARMAVAQVAFQDGDPAYARFALHGSYDDETDHRIALAAIKLARGEGPGRGMETRPGDSE